jgi:transcription elongation GreA/GreB family factor
MEVPEKFSGWDESRLEGWFFDQVEAEERDTSGALELLAWIYGSGRGEQALAWAELLLEALKDARDEEGVLGFYQLRLKWPYEDAPLRGEMARVLKSSFRSRVGKAAIKHVGLDDNQVALPECMRRLDLLLGLKKGTLCHNATWGFGIVNRLDEFYGKVTVDFAGKPGHEVSFAYAAESLELIDEGHLQARKYRDSEGVAALVASDAAEVVRIVLRSYGDLPIQDLQELILKEVPGVDDWKPFWDRARKDLKADPLVDIPSKRNDPIRLLARPRSYGAEWFAALRELRGTGEIFDALNELRDAVGADGVDDAGREAIADRLGFVIWGAEGKDAATAARAILEARAYGAVTDGCIGERIVLSRVEQWLFTVDALMGALAGLPARSVPLFFAYLWEHCSASIERLAGLLPVAGLGVVTAAVEQLVGAGHEEIVRDTFADLVTRRVAPPAALLWLVRHNEEVSRWGFVADQELLSQVLDCTEREACGEQLKAQNQLREMFEQSAWLKSRLAPFSADQRRVMLERVNASRGWDEVGRRAVIAGLIKAFPELADAMAGPSKRDEPVERPRLTSWRSYRERQRALKHLIEVEIPENSREIAVARSYGDLRENAEYKYAKEHQTILHRRRAEFEEDLKSVKGSDFIGFPAKRTGVGTTVVLRKPDGSEVTYTIMGEWDRDEELSIISCESRLAQLLEGYEAGAELELPTATASEVCQLVSVAPLTDELLVWARG